MCRYQRKFRQRIVDGIAGQACKSRSVSAMAATQVMPPASFTEAGTLYLDNFSWVTDVSWAVVKRGREGRPISGRAIYRYKMKEASTETLGCQHQDRRKAAWDGPSEGEYAVGSGYPVQVEASLAVKGDLLQTVVLSP